MRFPLRPFAALSAGLLCLTVCGPASASPRAPSPVSAPASALADNRDSPEPPALVLIPGPLRSFLRMAGISQEVTPQDVLPLLSRNVFLQGFSNGSQTEYLLLLNRYVDFSREVQSLTDSQGMIRISGCDDADRLLDVLGYQFQGGCGGADTALVTQNPERAFLTIDSGFPLTGLEEALQNHREFVYAYPGTPVPVLFRDTDWTALSDFRGRTATTVLDLLLHDQRVDRLYWAMSKQDTQTRLALHRAPGLKALLPVGSALDFYGSQLTVRDGHVLVPGGSGAERAWEELAGANPNSAGSFVNHLLSRDRGWAAAWFDAVARLPLAQQKELTSDPARMRRLLSVYVQASAGVPATQGVFPRNGELLILLSQLRWQTDGEIAMPGNLDLWREILLRASTPKVVREWVRRAKDWHSSEQLLMTLVASSSYDVADGPAQMYVTLSAIDRARGTLPHLSEATVRLLASRYALLHSWYLSFSEFPTLDDTSIAQFMTAAEAVNAIPNAALRSNALGAFQASVGLWQILARQQEIPADKMNSSWQGVVQPYASIQSSVQLFEAGRSSLHALMLAATGDPNLTADISEDQLIEVLAGPAQTDPTARRVHQQLADRIRQVLDDQRLVSLDTLYGLYDGLDQLAHGAAVRAQLLPLAGSLREFEMPRPIFSGSEKLTWAPEIYTSRHTELQVRTDLTKVIQSTNSPAQLESARGQLTPFLRDTLVGLNYAYYEPPGAQVLHHNPLFVRSHDFSGKSIQGFETIWDAPELVGIGVTAGGGAYLIGSLANLPFALATTEEDFIAPQNVQALIWRAAVPALLVDAVRPRWWSLTPAEMHAAALYQRAAEELLLTAVDHPDVRAHALAILSDVASSKQLGTAEDLLQDRAHAAALLQQIVPAEKFYLEVQARKLYPAEAAAAGPASQELQQLAVSNADATDPQRISRDFGVPHPTLAQTNACSIVSMKPVAAFGGNPYRLLGESWQSSSLYWARLADEMGYPPVALNLLAPELTHQMIARIFATDLEDWPALTRAMEQTGEAFRQGRIRVAGISPSGQTETARGQE